LKFQANIDIRVIPPGVLHWVIGMDNAICVGQHFYSTSMICSSVIAIIHSFLMSGRLMNEDHLETRMLLYQMMVFWSLRLDHTDIDGKCNSPIYTSSAKFPQGLSSPTYHLLLASLMSYTSAFLSFSRQHSIGGGTKPSLYLPLLGRLIMWCPISILSSWFS
jgi:hypothetical protein